jgi:hypothetical protein
MVGDELNHPGAQFGERAGNWNEQLPAAAGRHQRENLFQRDTVAAENIAVPETSFFHRKNEADRNIAHVDEVHDEIQIHSKESAAEKMLQHGGRRCQILVVRSDRHRRTTDNHGKTGCRGL